MTEKSFFILFLCVALVAIGGLITTFVLLRRNSKNRKEEDKPVPQHKHSFKSPTWRFQKLHPNVCPHDNGIYREVEMKVLDKTIKKTIFVCADCVSAIEMEEIEHRDKFKQ